MFTCIYILHLYTHTHTHIQKHIELSYWLVNQCSPILLMRLREVKDLSHGHTDITEPRFEPRCYNPGQSSFSGFHLYYWAPWQGGEVGGKRGRDRLVLMRVDQKWLTERERRSWSQKREGGLDLENRERGISRISPLGGRCGLGQCSTGKVWFGIFLWASTLRWCWSFHDEGYSLIPS